MITIERIFIFFLFTASLFPIAAYSEDEAAAGDEYRVFTSQNGNTIEAKVTAVFGDTVKITRKDGKAFKFKGSMLSEEDRAFLIEWSKNNISYHVTINHRNSAAKSQLGNPKGLKGFQMKETSSVNFADLGRTSSDDEQKDSSEKRNFEITLRNLSTGDIANGSIFVRLIMIRRTSEKKGKDSERIVQWEGGTSLEAFPKAASKTLETAYAVKKIRTRYYHRYDVNIRNSNGTYTTVSQKKLFNVKSIRDTLEGIQVWVTHGNKIIAEDHYFSSVLKTMETFELSEDLPAQAKSFAKPPPIPLNRMNSIKRRMPGELPPRPGRYVLMDDGTFKELATGRIIGPPRYRRQENGSMMDSVTKMVIEVPLYQYLDEGRIKNTETGEIVRVRVPKPRVKTPQN